MSYATKNVRNICLMGHGGNGKTTLAESMLFMTGTIDRLGKITDGTTVSDFDAEETRRKISISDSALYCEHKNIKINIIDTPGYFDFAGEVNQALRVADAGIIVCSAKDGLNVGAEKAWEALETTNKPRAIFISKTDEENARYKKAIDSLREKLGISVCPMVTPIVDNEKVIGVIDISRKKAYKYIGGERSEIAIPDDMSDTVDELSTALSESIAETSEELMDKYFDGEAFTEEEMNEALGSGLRDCSICPVFCGSSISGLGVQMLLDAIVDFFPYPQENGERVDADAPTQTIIFKTIADQYGKFSMFKAVAGKVTKDMTLVNPRTDTSEKIGHLYVMQGKKNVEVDEVACGDIGAFAKLSDTKTGDTLCDPKVNEAVEGITFEKPNYSMSISPKIKGQDDKIAQGLNRLGEEDPSFTLVNNAETHQMVLSGAGDIQLDVLCSKLKNKFFVEVELAPARVPYREKISKTVKVQGRHKKQSGGHGQFGDVWIEFSPQDESEELIFEESVFGGSVPKNYFPAVEKGLRESISKGVLAGYPVVFLRAKLVDGSYHPVDSSDMAFKTAASLAFKNGLPQAKPVILEPIGLLKVRMPDSYMGDIMSDISKRRGSTVGMSSESGMQIVEAEIPMAEMSSYTIDLRSMTQGRGSFSFEFVRYEETPSNVQEKIIEDAKALAEAE